MNLSEKLNDGASSSDTIPKGAYERSPLKVTAAFGALVLAIVGLNFGVL